MRKKGTSDRNLEAFRIFPYMAWFLIITFAYFVYKISLDLGSVTKDIEIKNDQLEKQIEITGKDMTGVPKKR